MIIILQIDNEVKTVGENGEEVTKIITFQIKFIISVRSMESSLSNLANTLPAGIQKFKYLTLSGKIKNM